ncbi:MAG: hypothetical protein WEB03_08435 [Nitriliruptor sp.]|uniref:FitA-like ribbon-helix-helix domain-containing protein n=1 Tax=Nitriliruptor sp. TaxID=2448056 RepID=UPI0034A07275
MAQVLIRDLPDDVVTRLEARARARGEPLAVHLRLILEDSVRLDRDGFVEAAREIRARSRDPQVTDSTDLIRTSRDRDHQV